MAIKVLYVATLVKNHIMQFHIPFLKMCKEVGWETAVAARNDYDVPSDCNIPYCDTYFDISFERSPIKAKNVTAYRELKKIIEQGNYDIIHCHTPVGAMITRLAAQKARRKGATLIYTAHGFHFFDGAPLKNWLLYYPVEYFLAQWTDILITINREDHHRARKFKAGKIIYVPGVGIDTEKFTKPICKEQRSQIRAEMCVPDDAILMCSVGELNTNKNHSLVIKALAALDNKNLHYCIAGEGDCRESLITLAKNLGIADRVHLLGYRSNVYELYKSSDIFCFPSLREGLPVSLMEAMASGITVVASRIRGNVDLLGKENQMLFDPHNVDECRAKIEKAIDEYTMVNEYTDKILPFTKETVMEKIKEIYGIIE